MNYESLIEITSFSPNSLNAPDSWIGHLHFGAWLIKEVRPKIFVELGTHSGNSYFTFCQAIKEFQTGTKCYAVDTWQGDKHAGYYGEEVYTNVLRHQEDNYSGFSRLMRMTFDNAALTFDDETIDLLHIDGLHDYDSVHHDFETWLPKLTKNAIVLFHDTNVHERGFGVWKLWRELLEKYHKNLEFSHSNGLGVLQLGEIENCQFTWLNNKFTTNERFVHFFSCIGLKELKRYNLKTLQQHNSNLEFAGEEYEKRIKILNNRISERDSIVIKHNKTIETLNNKISEKDSIVIEYNKTIETLHQEIKKRDRLVFNLEQSLDEHRQGIEHYQRVISERDDSLKDKNKQIILRDTQLAEFHSALQRAQHRYETTENSFIWKSTKPLRVLLDKSYHIRNIIHRIIKLCCGVITSKFTVKLKIRKGSIANQREVNKISAELETTSRLDENSEQKVEKNKIPPEIARPIEFDFSVSVPFSSKIYAHPKEPNLVVICHLFYEKFANGFAKYLLNIPFPFKLCISTNTQEKKDEIARCFAEWPKGEVEIRVTVNCGRDIAPKLIGFKDVYEKHEYVLFLHSKKSCHASVLATWRGFFLENLIGSPEIIKSVFHIFNRYENIGIISGQHFEPVRHWVNWGNNFPLAKNLAIKMGFDIFEKTVLDFPSGSMFYARCSAIKPLLDLNLSFEDFAEEGGQVDGTLAHSIERIMYHVCEYADHDWLKISHKPIFPNTPSIIDIESNFELDYFLKNHLVSLTGDKPPQPRLIHPVPVAEPAKRLITKLQNRALGTEEDIPSDFSVAIGVVSYNNHASEISRLLVSAEKALANCGLSDTSLLLMVDNGEPTNLDKNRFQKIHVMKSLGNIGFGKAHNYLMKDAFKCDADVYIAVNPDGAFHPNSIDALVKMSIAENGRALIEASQFPSEHPKQFDPFSFETQWVSGACMLIPKTIYKEIGGFDENFFMYCEDVDLSWRALANGFVLRICPTALFMHSVTNRDIREIREMIFTSGLILSQKWRNKSFEDWLKKEFENLQKQAPEVSVKQVPDSWLRFSNFSYQFSFSPVRW